MFMSFGEETLFRATIKSERVEKTKAKVLFPRVFLGFDSVIVMALCLLQYNITGRWSEKSKKYLFIYN